MAIFPVCHLVLYKLAWIQVVEVHFFQSCCFWITEVVFSLYYIQHNKIKQEKSCKSTCYIPICWNILFEKIVVSAWQNSALFQRCYHILWISFWGISSAGRAHDWQSWGQRFDPAMLHHFFPLPTNIWWWI